MTSATKITRKSGLSNQQSPGFGEDAYDGTINDRDGDFNPDPDREFDDEDMAEEERRANEEKSK